MQPEIARTLEILALCDWRPEWLEYGPTGAIDRIEGETRSAVHGLRPSFLVELSDSCLREPRPLPVFGDYLGTNWIYEEYDEQGNGADDRTRYLRHRYSLVTTADFESLSRTASQLTSILNANVIDPTFLRTALRFLRFGAIDRTSAGLLWNVCVLEALFGRDVQGGVREMISKCLQNVYRFKQGEAQHFDKLYDLRSDIVHGRKAFGDEDCLSMARARRYALDSVEYTIAILHEVQKHMCIADSRERVGERQFKKMAAGDEIQISNKRVSVDILAPGEIRLSVDDV